MGENILDSLVSIEGYLSIIDKNKELLSSEELSFVESQRSNLDKAMELYKLVGQIDISTMEQITKRILATGAVNSNVDIQETVVPVSDVVSTEQSVESQDLVLPGVTQEVTATSASEVIDNVVSDVADSTVNVDNVSTEVVDTAVGVPTVETAGSEVTTEPQQTEQSTEFVLSPMDDGIATAVTNETPTPVAEDASVPSEITLPVQTSEEATDNVASEVTPPAQSTEEVTLPVPATQEVGENVVTDVSVNSSETQRQLDKYNRNTENPVKAILVTKVQFDKLSSSRVNQKNLFSGNSVDNQTADVNAVVPNVSDQGTQQADLQSMIEQANTLYKDGKVQEAQVLFDKIAEINKQSQVQTGSTDPNVLVKK